MSSRPNRYNIAQHDQAQQEMKSAIDRSKLFIKEREEIERRASSKQGKGVKKRGHDEHLLVSPVSRSDLR